LPDNNAIAESSNLIAAASITLDKLKKHEGESKNARRDVSLTSRAQEMLMNRLLESKSEYVFANYAGKPYLVTCSTIFTRSSEVICSFRMTA
jgi:hypothetical protein